MPSSDFFVPPKLEKPSPKKNLHQGKSRWHSHHVLVYISPVLTYLLGTVPLTMGYSKKTLLLGPPKKIPVPTTFWMVLKPCKYWGFHYQPQLVSLPNKIFFRASKKGKFRFLWIFRWTLTSTDPDRRRETFEIGIFFND